MKNGFKMKNWKNFGSRLMNSIVCVIVGCRFKNFPYHKAFLIDGERGSISDSTVNTNFVLLDTHYPYSPIPTSISIISSMQ